MDEKKDAKAKPAETKERIDEVATQVFQAMGCNPESPTLTRFYTDFKRKKDLVQPGRLTAEGYAFVAMLASLVDLADSKAKT